MEKELWVAEYSHTQECFHYDLLDRVIKMNKKGVENGYPLDYIIFFIGEKTAAWDALNKMDEFLKERGIRTKYFDDGEFDL